MNIVEEKKHSYEGCVCTEAEVYSIKDIAIWFVKFTDRVYLTMFIAIKLVVHLEYAPINNSKIDGRNIRMKNATWYEDLNLKICLQYMYILRNYRWWVDITRENRQFESGTTMTEDTCKHKNRMLVAFSITKFLYRNNNIKKKAYKGILYQCNKKCRLPF